MLLVQNATVASQFHSLGAQMIISKILLCRSSHHFSDVIYWPKGRSVVSDNIRYVTLARTLITVISQSLICCLAHTDVLYLFFYIYALHLKIASTVHKSISVMNENDLETNLSEDMAGILREGVQ